MIVVVPDALSVHTSLSTIQVLLFARLLAERIASKGRPDLSQMINLLSRNRTCSNFISSLVTVRPALSPPRSPPFLSNKFLLNADRRLCTPKRQSPGLYSRLPISRSGAPACQNFVISAKQFSSGSADFNPSERVDLMYLRLARFGYSQGSSSRVAVWIDLARWTCLSSPPLSAERVTVFCFRLFRLLVPRSQKSKTKMG
jgi:hypothetical protein